jgi:hypothetical protein
MKPCAGADRATDTAVKTEWQMPFCWVAAVPDFPAGIKVQTVAEDAPFPRYVVCNADEMEPGTFKDRVFLHAEPHMLIEGMILAALLHPGVPRHHFHPARI